jgi:hypothetical protein
MSNAHIDPQSGCRIPLPRREDLDAEGQKAFDFYASGTPQRAHVAHPARLVAQHGHQVAVTLVGDDNYGKRDLPPGFAASNLDRRSLAWSDANRKGDGAQAV